MNSILRQSHIRSIDLRSFLHSYDSTNTTAVTIWARSACAKFQPGFIVFIVEPVTLPFGLISFVRKEEEENFRITDFAVVVRKEDNKVMAVNLTNNTYELRFLESLLEEKARKAVIDRKRFSFVAAQPSSPLASAQIQKLENLSRLYAKGGSRRVSVNTNAQEEPSVALLSACGVHLNLTNANKQPLDLGSICFSLFNSDFKHPDVNRSQLKNNFIPLPNGEPESASLFEESYPLEGKSIDSLLEKSEAIKAVSSQENTGFNLLQSWASIGEPQDTIVKGSLAEHFNKETIERENSFNDSQAYIIEEQKTDQENFKKNESPPLDNLSILKDEQVMSSKTEDLDNVKNQLVSGESEQEDVYKHLSEAITDLLGPQFRTEITEEKTLSVDKLIPAKVKHFKGLDSDKRKMPAVRSFDKLPAFDHSITCSPDRRLVEPLTNEDNSIPLNAGDFSVLDATTTASNSKIEEVNTADKVASPENQLTDSIPDSGKHDLETEDAVAIFSASEMLPSKLDDFQEPKVVMNEMASLMSKLESQVARAAKKLAARASEIESHLTANLDELLQSINKEDKDSYAELVVRIDLLSKQFESLFDTLKTELAEKAASHREQIKSKLDEYESKVNENQEVQHEKLVQEFTQNKEQFSQLEEAQKDELSNLADAQAKSLNKRIVSLAQNLEDIFANLNVQLEGYSRTFEERAQDNAQTLLKAFDHHLNILHKDVELLHNEGKEQLSLSKREFFGRLDRLIQITEIAISRQARRAQTELFLPKLKEHKQIIEAIMNNMSQTFVEHSFSQAKAQSEGADHSLVLARQQLKELVDERLCKLDLVGRNQQNGLEEIFKSASDPLEKNTMTVIQLLKQAEQEINECEAVCAKLAQSYNLDSDPKLTSLRQDVHGKADSLKAQLKANLESGLEENCLKLEDANKTYHVELSAKRAELVQQVRSASDNGLQRIRQAIHDAFHTVQSEREKYME